MVRFWLFTVVLCMAWAASACVHAPVETPAEIVPTAQGMTPVTELWVSDPATDLESPDVLILLQGGPHDFLYFERDGRTLSRYLPGYADHHVVYLHQAQTLNPDLFRMGQDFTLEQAREEMAATTDMLRRAIEYFSDAGKSVTVIGHSYGAFIIAHHLSLDGPLADKYIVSAGRLDVPLAMVADHKAGMSSEFEPDGRTYIPASQRLFGDDEADEASAFHARSLLKAAYGEPCYTLDLADRDLSKVVYVTGDADQNVGVLSSAETAFLESHGATVLYVEGGHYDVYKRMIDAVSSGQIEY